jgi:hypothetical protein
VNFGLDLDAEDRDCVIVVLLIGEEVTVGVSAVAAEVATGSRAGVDVMTGSSIGESFLILFAKFDLASCS